MAIESESSNLSRDNGSAKKVEVELVNARVDRQTSRTARNANHLTVEAERFIVSNPWRAVGIAVGIGLIAGSLIALAPRAHRDS